MHVYKPMKLHYDTVEKSAWQSALSSAFSYSHSDDSETTKYSEVLEE